MTADYARSRATRERAWCSRCVPGCAGARRTAVKGLGQSSSIITRFTNCGQKNSPGETFSVRGEPTFELMHQHTAVRTRGRAQGRQRHASLWYQWLELFHSLCSIALHRAHQVTMAAYPSALSRSCNALLEARAGHLADLQSHTVASAHALRAALSTIPVVPGSLDGVWQAPSSISDVICFGSVDADGDFSMARADSVATSESTVAKPHGLRTDAVRRIFLEQPAAWCSL